jgi:hypothetical protein
LLYDIQNACILKQRLIGASSELHLFSTKVGAKYAPGPTQPPRMPNFQEVSMVYKINGLDIKSRILHSDEVEGDLNWVNSLLALFGVSFVVGTTSCNIRVMHFNLIFILEHHPPFA